MDIALSSAPGGKVVFQIAIAGFDLRTAKGRASQVGVQDDAGRVDHPRHRRAPQSRQALENLLLHRTLVRKIRPAAPLENSTDFVNDQLTRIGGGSFTEPRINLMHRRKRSPVHLG